VNPTAHPIPAHISHICNSLHWKFTLLTFTASSSFEYCKKANLPTDANALFNCYSIL
jgi:hypothetical protein